MKTREPQEIGYYVRGCVEHQLTEFEREKNVKVLYACESGSRAWGFESEDSDYDIRFIYQHDLKWYLKTRVGYSKLKDTITTIDTDRELDYSGWDLKKTLNLFKKGNPHLFEYLRSPVIYKVNVPLLNNLRTLSEHYFNAKSSVYHYLHMAQNNYERYLLGEEISYKKYLYVLRPLMCCQWIEHLNATPPVEFQELVNTFVSDWHIRGKIDELLDKKRSGKELDKGKPITLLNEYLDQLIKHYSVYAKEVESSIDKKKQRVMNDELDALFYKMVVQ